MVSRLIKTEADRKALLTLLSARKLPLTVEITSGQHRTIEQNSLQRLWLREAAEQLGDRTQEELRGYCKLTLGVPILRAENKEFREKYDAVIRPLPYPAKLAIMMEPLDLPVTRLMTTGQKTRYLDAMSQHFAEMGVRLTEPGPPTAGEKVHAARS